MNVRSSPRLSRRRSDEQFGVLATVSRAGAAGTVSGMEIDADHQQTAAALVGRASEVTFAEDPDLWRRRLNRLSGGVLGRHRRWRSAPRTDAPWEDVPSFERVGWRERVALHEDDGVFSVEYHVCRRCRLGWVEYPYTDPRFRRAGLAAAGLAALRAEHADSGLSWHTLGGHGQDSRQFWDRVGETVPGAYRQRERCVHIARPCCSGLPASSSWQQVLSVRRSPQAQHSRKNSPMDIVEFFRARSEEDVRVGRAVFHPAR